MNFRRRRASLTAATLIALIGVGGCSLPHTQPESTIAREPHWDYGKTDGPDKWSSLSNDFSACSAGKQESPIDLPEAVPTSTEEVALEIDSATSGTVTDSGHAMQFTAEISTTTTVFDNKSFGFVQMHSHMPSEHTVAGLHSAAEFHFVFQSQDKEHLVVSVFANVGPASEAWENAAQAFEQGNETPLSIDIAALMPSSLNFYGYDGSLTTPPCTEDVKWAVFSTPITISQEQLDDLASLHSGNDRPTQPLEGRTIHGGRLTILGE